MSYQTIIQILVNNNSNHNHGYYLLCLYDAVCITLGYVEAPQLNFIISQLINGETEIKGLNDREEDKWMSIYTVFFF